MEYLLLFAGFVLLLYGGDLLVKGGVSLANRFGVPPLVVGLTVVSFGTSAPELFVSVVAALKNHPEVAIGNVIGSNIANVALVLGLTALIFPIPVRSSSVKIDAPFMLIISLVLWFFMRNSNQLQLTRTEGAFFVFLLVSYTLFLIFVARKQNRSKLKVPDSTHEKSIWVVIAMLVLAYVGLAFGSDLLVTNAGIIATEFGISERVIAITVVAFGTSLPELATSVIAAFRKQMDISIGNIIGSNIFNILAVLGITGLVKPIPVAEGFLRFDIFWMLGTSLLLFFFILPFKGGKLTRPKAGFLFACYCVYIYLLYFKSA